jgi:prepilin-type N-terminal cleavage/methylation domain-containing protein
MKSDESKKKSKEKCCGNCRWWFPDATASSKLCTEIHPFAGTCHGGPPAASRGINALGEWPLTLSSWGCGRFKRLKPHDGLTLVELLVTISIVSVLAMFVLPRVTVDSETRRANGAARIVVSAMNLAKSRSYETGRPCGVRFIETEGRHGACRVIQQVEQPPLYGGSSEDSTLQLSRVTTDDGHAWFYADVSDLVVDVDYISAGDRAQFNGQGAWYTVRHIRRDYPVAGVSRVQFQSVRLVDMVPDYPYPVTFQFKLAPRPSMGEPAVLPGDSVVDLSCSGYEMSLFESGGSVTVMFTPTGRLGEVYYVDRGEDRRVVPLSNLYLLVGSIGQTPDPVDVRSGPVPTVVQPDSLESSKPNWQRMSSRWVVVRPSTALVRWELNATTPVWDADMSGSLSPALMNGLAEARKFVEEQ